jgi:regulator of RNase E activity RraA
MTDDDIRALLATMTTAGVSDALDRLDRGGAVPGLLPFDPAFRIVGRAFTGRYEPVDEAGGTVGDFVDDVPEGAVVVLDNQGRLDCTVWGDILTAAADRRGIAGTVIDGVCRDVAASLRIGYPVFTRGRSMRTGKDRVRLAATGVPVMLGDVRVEPGDWLLGDADGVVVIAAAHAPEVLETAAAIEAAEARIRERAAAGERLDAVRADIGYHGLQARAAGSPG